MKKQLVLLSISTIFLCCSSAKNVVSPINHYLDTIVNDSKNKIIILDKKIPNKRTLGIFKGNYMFSTKTNKYEREGRLSPLYNKKDWEHMSKKYSFDTIAKYWEAKDFKIKKAIVIANYNKFLKGELYKDFNNNDYPIYSFSEPIPYKNNKYVLFTVLQSSASFGSEFSEFVIIMENKSNKWIIIDKVWEN